MHVNMKSNTADQTRMLQMIYISLKTRHEDYKVEIQRMNKQLHNTWRIEVCLGTHDSNNGCCGMGSTTCKTVPVPKFSRELETTIKCFPTQGVKCFVQHTRVLLLYTIMQQACWTEWIECKKTPIWNQTGKKTANKNGQFIRNSNAWSQVHRIGVVPRRNGNTHQTHMQQMWLRWQAWKTLTTGSKKTLA